MIHANLPLSTYSPAVLSTKIPSTKVLLVEDDLIDQRAFIRHVQQSHLPYDYQIANSLTEAKAILTRECFDIAILDFHLGDGTALELIEQVRERDLPFIIATGGSDEEIAVKLMQWGAQDYLIKDPDRTYLKVLAITVENAISRKQSERQIRLLNYAMQNIQDYIYIVEDGRLLFINNALSVVCNCPVDIAIGQAVQVLQQPDLTQRLEAPDLSPEAVCAGEAEITMRRGDGSSFPVLLSESFVQEGSRHLRIGVLRNITHLKQVEAELRSAHEALEEKVEARTTQLLQTNELLLQEVQERFQAESVLGIQTLTLERIAKANPLPDILDDLLQSIELQLKGSLAAIMLCDQEGTLRVGAAPHLPGPYLQAIDGIPVQEGAGSCGTAAFRGEPVIVRDIANDPLWQNHTVLAQTHGFAACWATPIVSGSGQVVGTFSVYYHDTRTPLPRELDILALAASIAGIAIEQDQATQALTNLNQELEQRVAERTVALQEREAQLQDFLDNANDLIQSVLLENGRFEYVNRAWQETLGYSATEIQALTIFDVLHPNCQAHCCKVIAQMRAGAIQAIDRIELTFLTKDQREVLVEGSINCRMEQHGPVASRAIFRNITERKHAEAALQKSEATNRAMIQAIPDLLIHIDSQGNYLQVLSQNQWNTPQLLKLDQSPHLFNTLPPDLAAQQFQEVQRALSTGQLQVHEQQLEVNGELHYEEVRIMPMQSDHEALIMVRDITDRKHFEATLTQYSQEVEDLYNNAPCGYHSLDSQGRIIRTNNTELRWLGYTREELLGTEFSHLLTDANRQLFHQTFLEFKQRGWIKDLECDLVCKDGSLFPVVLSAIAITDASGNYVSSRATLFDNRDRKAAKEQLQQSNRQLAAANAELARATQLKDEFLANMSHELRTPLNAILGLSEALQEAAFGSLNTRQLRFVTTIEKSGRHLLELINDILDLAKIEAGKLKLETSFVNVQHLCYSSLALVKQQAMQKQIQIKTNISPQLDHIAVDELRMRQVLINLLTNAVKFTPEGGRIELEVHPEPCATPQETPNALAYDVCFSVSDTGIGIAPEHIEKLFQSFVQIDSRLNRQYNGTGLGLALVKKITELHSGRVSVSSELGQGSCFKVSVPQQPESISSSPLPRVQRCSSVGEQTTPQAVSGERPLILLAEDNQANIVTFSGYLSMRGYQVVVANDGYDAIAAAKLHRPQIILMDIQMPRMDGLTAIRQIRADPDVASIPVVALTALVMSGDREKCLQAGATEYLAKPIKLRQLVATIQTLLESRQV